MSDRKHERWSPTGEDAIEYNRCLRSVAEKREDLRDYFAGQALAGVAANPGSAQTLNEIAWGAYQMADAMLAERNKEEKT